MAKYMTYADAAKEIERIIREEMKVEGLMEVSVVRDRGGYINNIGIVFDARVKKDIWDEVRKFDFRDLPSYGRIVVNAYSESFKKELVEELDKRDKSILATSRNYKKPIIVQAAHGESLLDTEEECGL